MSNRALPVVGIAILVIATGCPSQPSNSEPAGSGQTTGGGPATPAAAPSTPAAKLSAAESEVFLKKFNLAVGLLENNDTAAGIPAWDDLAKQFPKELAIAQNRAIAGILGVANATNNHGNVPAAKAVAEAAFADLKTLDPDSATTAVLEAKLSEKSLDNVNSPDAARKIRALQYAAEKAPQDVTFWVELFDAAKTSRDQQVQDIGYAAIQKAHELESHNLYVLRLLLDVAAKRNDPKLAEYLRAAREEIRPLSELIAARAKLDPAKKQDPVSVFEAAIGPAEKGEWTSPAIRGIRGLTGVLNVLNADDAIQSDMLAIQRHELEYLNDQLSDELKSRLTIEPRTPQAGTVVFVPWQGSLGTIALPDGTDFAVLDFTLDRQLDVATLSPGRLQILEQSNGAWTSVAETSVPDGYSHLVAFDLDDDRENVPAGPTTETGKVTTEEDRVSADLDVVLYGKAGLLAVVNEWDESVHKRSLAPIEAFGDPRLTEVRAVVAFDADIDGDLDLVASAADGIHLLLNLGNKTFRVGDALVLEQPAGAGFQSAVAVDFDRDVDLDVLMATSDNRLAMLENLRHGIFRWKSLSDPASAQVVDVAELDGNVSWDVITAAEGTLRVTRTRTVAKGDVQFLGTSDYTGAPSPAELLTLDLDNSATVDVVAYGAAGPQFWQNPGDGSLQKVEVAGLSNSATPWVRAASVDLDSDGNVDLAALTGEAIQFWKNESANSGHYLNVHLLTKKAGDSGQSVSSKRINHYGYGSLLEMKAGDRYHAETVRSQQTHFGLDGIEQADLVRVTWPNGIPQNVIQPKNDSSILELQSLSTSCPYLYSWNGRKFVFVTDLLWAAPMGLPDGKGEMVPCREWEYLKIPSESLQPRNGHYVLSITEELWETAYFDQVELIAVDHPREIDVFTNEKVGPAEMARPMIHTARRLLAPQSATTLKGHDILPVIRYADAKFARTWSKLLMQGYADRHGVELKLGDIRNATTIKLFLIGWLKPTDAGLATSIHQNPDLDGPTPPAIEVPDGENGWKVAMPYMGFPGGKTKSMVVDISGLVNADDPRLRIVTSQELYWDQIAFTVDEAPETVVEQVLALESAELHERGYSGTAPSTPNGPERYDYDMLQTEPRFPPMKGRLTRYGEITKLLKQADDRVAIIGSGDEILLKFALPATPLPEGWVRDFVIHNVGWEKDAQLNTVLGKTVEPLPYLAMPQYPYVEGPPETPEYEEYLRTWQTREMTDTDFRRLIKRGPKDALHW